MNDMLTLVNERLNHFPTSEIRLLLSAQKKILMQRTIVLSIACAAAIAVTTTGCKPADAKKGVGIDVANLDTATSPGKDFFQYANGGWCKANPIPADQSRWASFSILLEDNKKNLRTIAEDLASKQPQENASKQGAVK